MEIRRATMKDALDVLAWRNDPHTIAMSRTPGIVDQATHLAWFAKAIADQDRIILIATEDGRRLGMVRFDRSDGAWLVSINLAPEARGKGYGRAVLTEAMAVLRASNGPCRLSAEIKGNNAPSLRLFERCGFVQQD